MGLTFPSKKIFFFLSCVRDRRIKEPFHFVVENETGYDDRRDSVLLQSDNRAHAVEALFVLSNRPLRQGSGVLVPNVVVLLYVSNRIKIRSQAEGCQGISTICNEISIQITRGEVVVRCIILEDS